ncbi:MAG: hypothetical protein AAF244_04205 [Pseudomonadota bacterium]
MSDIELTNKQKETIVDEILFETNADALEKIETDAADLVARFDKARAENPDLPVTKEELEATLRKLLATEKRFSQSDETNGMNRSVDLRQLAGLPDQAPA